MGALSISTSLSVASLARRASGTSLSSSLGPLDEIWAVLNLLLRPFQREIIEAALAGHDVYVQAATSFGKSLCFQLPAVVNAGSKNLVRILTWRGGII
jgi:ATP-dependent helicase YprA (DUF1998 family)